MTRTKGGRGDGEVNHLRWKKGGQEGVSYFGRCLNSFCQLITPGDEGRLFMNVDFKSEGDYN